MVVKYNIVLFQVNSEPHGVKIEVRGWYVAYKYIGVEGCLLDPEQKNLKV